ncbi:hypothetical protein BRC91_07450 [Halobacteriales archaeon QS_4_62_28]|nr:MAG: hypothetical protein BRC91_07450 [Halobacteriales archaeon QS_4_62_28]
MAADSQIAIDKREREVLVTREDTGLSRRKYLAAVTALAGSPMLAGCAGDGDSGAQTGDGTETGDGDGVATDTASGEPRPGGHLRTSLVSPVNHFDLHINGLMVASIVGYQSVEKLFEPNTDLELVELLATDVSISDDGLTWDITLREGAMFHPPYERELVAEDVVANFERILDEDVGSFRSLVLSAVDSMEATGDYSLRLELAEQQASLQAGLGGYFGIPIFSPEAIEEGNIRKQPVGTGPFVFEEWTPEDQITLSAYDNYWTEDRPYVDQVTIRPIAEASVLTTELTDGNLHMLHKTPADFKSQLENDDSVTVHETDGLGYRALHVNPGSTPTDGRANGLPTTDPQVRRAVLEAVNRTAMVEIIEGGLGTPTQNYFPDDHPWHVDYTPYTVEANPERARELIGESGFSEPVPITIISASSDPVLQQLGTITRDNLSQAGFEPDLTEYDIGTWVTEAEAFRYDVNVNYFAGWFHPDGLRAWIDPDGLTQMNYETENRDRIFELFDELNSTTDKSEADPLNEELQQLMIDDAAYVPMYHPRKVRTTRNTVQDFTVHPFHLAYRLDEVWLDE